MTTMPPTLRLVLPRLLTKAHVGAYTRSDGTFVAAHEDNRVPMQDGKIATHRFAGPEHEASSSDAVHNPIHHPDAERFGGAPPSRIEFERKGVTHVDHRSIISPQKSLNPRKVNRIASEFDDNEADPVHLIKMADGRHVLAGGNHRTVAAIMSGRSKVKAHVIDHSELQKAEVDAWGEMLLKSGPGSGAKIAHSGKHALYGNPPRWHKITADKPAPKGAPVAAHPKSAGHHEPAAHFSDDQWAALKLPDSNVNAPVFNKALEKLKAWSDAGDVTAIVGASFGSNTYGQKLAKIANHLLGLHGSKHTVTPGQKPGSHAAAQVAEPADPHPTGLPEHLAPRAAKPEAEPAPAPVAASGPLTPPVFAAGSAGWQDIVDGAKKAFDAGDWEKLSEFAFELEHVESSSGKKAQAYVDLLQSKKPQTQPAPAGPLTMPAFEEGATTTGVKAHYEKVAQKVIDHGHAGNGVVLEDMKADGLKPNAKGKVSNTWAGKTANSKKLLALHAAALAHAGGAVPAVAPAPAAPAKEPRLVLPKKADGAPAAAQPEHAASTIPSFKGFEVGKVYQATNYGWKYQVKHDGSAWLGDGGEAGVFNPVKNKDLIAKLNDGKDFHGSLKPVQAPPDPLSVHDTPASKVLHVIPSSDSMAGYEVHVATPKSAPGSKFSVAIKDVDSGEFLPSVKMFPKESDALDHAHALAEGKKPDPSPKEGDTKPAADGGTLVLKDGHWVKQGGDAAQAAPIKVSGGFSELMKQIAPHGENQHAKNEIIDALSSGYEQKFVTKNADGKVTGAIAFGVSSGDPKKIVEVHHVGSLTSGGGSALLAEAKKSAKDHGAPIKLYSHMEAVGFYKKQGFDQVPGAPDGMMIWSDGSTPPSATGPLSAEQLANLQSIPWFKLKLPDTNTNAKSHNAAVAKIEAMAFAGDKAGLQAFIDAKGAAKQTYAKKQVLLAQTALAGLGEPGATAAVATEPVSSKPAKPTGLVSVHWSGVIDDIEQALNSGNAAKIDDHVTLAEGLESAGAKAAHAYATAALAHLSKTQPEAPAASPEPAANEAFNGWKAAMAAGKQPTKEQAEAYAALEDSDPDTAMEAFNDAIQSNIAGDVSTMADDEFDASLQLATDKVHKLHGWALSGKPVGVHPSVLESLESMDISDLQEMLEVGSLKPEVKAHIEKMIKPLSDDEKAALNNLTLENLESMSKLQLSKPMLAHIKKLIVRHKMSEPVEPSKVSVTSQVFHNTTQGHSKSWSVSVHGSTLKTEYGKIGGTQQTTVKHLASPQAAAAMKTTLIKQKSANGYTYQGDGTHEHEDGAKQGPKEGDTKMGADGMLILKNGHWVKMQTGDDGPGDWVHSPNDPGFSGAGTIGNHEGLIAFDPSMGAEYHDEASMMANTGDPSAQATTLQELVQKMEASGHAIPPLHMLQKLDPSFSASDMPGAAPSASHTTAAAPAMDTWTQTGKQGGSNPGGKFKDPAGQEWYCKFPNDADTAKSEVLAAKLYALAGLSSQDAQLVTKGGNVGIASKWVNITKAGSAAALAKVEGVHAGFAVDAWLGNWDVIGLALDNCQIGPDGKAHRVDAGGSLEYRAQGAKKPFGPKVDEIDTLRDAKLNPKSAAVFGKMTVADLTASVAKVAAIDDSAIRALVFDHGPGTDAQKKAMADTLIARKNDLIARFPKAAKPPKKSLDPTALPINPASLPKVHDFSNWNGPGAGLSSKAHVNKSNEAVEQAMRSLAATGNMVALADFKFQEVNKDTGEPTGKMLPVSKHPSKHVLQYQQDLLQVLDEVANPPQPLKAFRSTDVGSLAALNAAFPPKPFGTTVAKVQSNEKLGFWVALGAIGSPQKFKPKVLSNYTSLAVEAAKAKYKSASKLAKHFISSVQSSGSYNDLFRDGKSQDHQGNLLKDVAQAALAHATAMPEGTCLYRWQKMSPQMLEHIMSAKDGTVFQATGPMCTSYSPTATKGFGTHRVKVVYAKGAKAVESFGSGGFAGEKEVTTLPNARFVILSKKMVPDEEHGNPGAQRLELEILMLPPDLGI